MKLLIVDDEKTTFEILKETVDWKKLEIVSDYVSSARGAIKMIRNNQPEIIITDIKMPDMDGLELIEWIKAEDINAELIILSAYGNFEYAQQAINFGVSGYLLKPIKENELLKLLIKTKEKIIKKKIIEKKILNFKSQQVSNIFKKIIKSNGTFLPDKNVINEKSFQIIFMEIKEENYNFFVKKDQDINSYIFDMKTLITDFFTNFKIIFIKCSIDRLEFIVLPGLLKINTDTFLLNLSSLISAKTNMEANFLVSEIYNDINSFYFQYLNLLKSISKSISPRETSYNEKKVKTAIEYIKQHFAENITLDDICSFSAVSKNYFCSIFKKITDQSVWEFLTDLRIDISKDYLKNNNLNICEVAEKVGYDDPAYFSRIFKKKTGKPPSEYRSTIIGVEAVNKSV